MVDPGNTGGAAFLEVSPGVATIPLAGDSVVLTGTVRDARGRRLADALVMWESLEPSVAMVTATGMVVGLDEGSARIRGVHGALSDTAEVTVSRTPFPSKPAQLRIEPNTDTIAAVGGFAQLQLKALDKNGNPVPNANVSWFSLDGAVADVSNGRVAARRKGIARIMVTNGTLTDTAFVYVNPTIPVDQVTIEPRVDTMFAIGDELAMRAVARDASGNPVPGETITLSSDDPSIATIDARGVLTAAKRGEVRVTATHGKNSDMAVIAVEPVPAATGLVITPETDTIPTLGGSITLQVRLDGTNVKHNKLKWSSLDIQAIVSSNGVVTGRSKGVARIVAKYGSLADTALVWIAPAPASATPASVIVTPAVDTIRYIGNEKKLVASVLDTQGSPISGAMVTWSSSDASVVFVDANGIVSAMAAGMAKITAKNGSLSGFAQVYVTPEVKPMVLEIQPKQDTIPQVGSTLSMSVDVIGTNGTLMTGEGANWQSLDPSIAKVSATGTPTTSTLISGVGKGVARIVAANGTLADTAHVSVAPGPTPSSPAAVKVSPKSDTISTVGDTKQLTGVVVDAQGLTLSGYNVVWSALDPTVASVDGVGLVKALSAGLARIRASYGTFADTARIFIPTQPTSPPASIVITPDRDTIPAVGGTMQLAAVVEDASGNMLASSTIVTWSSLDAAIASVNGTGLVTGNAQGTARILAAAGTTRDTAFISVAPAATSLTFSLTHSPSNPSTSDAVTISVTASDPAAVSSITISVNGAAVKTCTSGTCAYTNTFAAGVYTYAATAKNTTGASLSAGSGSFSVSQPWTGSGPNPVSPHWNHMRTSVIDYRIHYQKDPQKSAEYDWAALHYDHVTGGLGILAEYRKRNPNIAHATYDKFWFTPVNDAAPMENWLANNGYSVENAYLHVAGSTKTQANRITAQQFAGRDYWYLNLKDPGFRAWRLQRTKSLMAGGSNTLFLDSNSPTTVKKYVPASTVEFATYADYFAEYNKLLLEMRAMTPAGYLIPNHAQNFSKADEMTIAMNTTGAVMNEYENTPYGSGVKEWNKIDELVAAGVVVQFATGVSPGSKNDQRGDVNPGNYNTIAERVLMWEYGSYLMVVDPNRMDAVFFESYGLNWSHPFSDTWLKAFERDIGLATATRSALASGTDGAGQIYTVFQRPFANNALVVIRPQSGTQYGNHTAVTVTLPGSYRLLRADGSLGPAVTTVQVRNSESLVFVK